MELFTQPFSGSLGDVLKTLLESGRFSRLDMAVAFAKSSGVLRLADDFEGFLNDGGEINAYVGVDLGGTSYEALTALLPRTTSLHIVHAENAQTFHSKIYDFTGAREETLIVGSHNLTGGGLWTNFESSLIVSASREDDTDIRDAFRHYVEELTSVNGLCMDIHDQADIDNLLRNGYVEKEATSIARRASERKTRKGDRGVSPLFGAGRPTKLPQLPKRDGSQGTQSQRTDKPAAGTAQTVQSLVSASESGDTIWFETRAMTGGSRNILDLSMKSLVSSGDPKGSEYDIDDPPYMGGAVRFFGMDPDDTLTQKNIVINFDGIDYSENTILFPKGDKANGTWRLQIKGKDSSGGKITEVFRKKGSPYLPNKIVSFTKIEDDHYLMSVFPTKDLDFFAEASWILAFNGATRQARRLGIIRND